MKKSVKTITPNYGVDEFAVEDGKPVDLNRLTAGLMPLSDYSKAHEYLVIPCHDVFIKYNGGILLVHRNKFPAKNTPWSIGGRVLRGVPTEESLRIKVKEECNLNLENIVYLGLIRAILSTDPFGHGKGTDCFSLIYFAEGKGELKLNPLHRDPIIVTQKMYTAEFKASLHPYIQKYLGLAMQKL